MHKLRYLSNYLLAFFAFYGQIVASVRQTRLSRKATESVQLLVAYALFAVICFITESVEANALENQVFELFPVFLLNFRLAIKDISYWNQERVRTATRRFLRFFLARLTN